MKDLIAEEARGQGFSEQAIQEFLEMAATSSSEVDPSEVTAMRADVRAMLKQFRLPGLN